MNEIPSYVPEFIVDWVDTAVGDAERMLSIPNLLDETQQLIEKEQKHYAENFISNALMLKGVYEEYGHNTDFFRSLFVFFNALARWKHSKKTSAKEDLAAVDEFIKHIKRALKSVDDSPALYDKINRFLRLYLMRAICQSNRDVTEKGKNLLHKALEIVLLPPKDKDGEKLYVDGYISTFGIAFGSDTNTKDSRVFLQHLVQYMETTRPMMAQKDIPIRKIHSSTAHIAYAAHILKQILVEHEIPEKQHVTHITDLINAIIAEEITDEDRIRKLIPSL